jgi:NADH dehydrogenase
MVPRKVTVFGGSGFIGRYVVRRLAKAGARIEVAVRDPEGAAFLKPMGDVGQIVPVACDVRDDASVAATLTGADAAVNLVGILFERRKGDFHAIHADAPQTIARAAAAAGVKRVVHVSALGADHSSPSEYGRTKALGEARMREEFAGAAVLKPSVVFGPEDDFFNRFAALARLSPALPLFGGGDNRFQPVYVCDVAEAVFAVLARRDTASGTFELGGPRVYTMKEIFELILAVTERERILLRLPMVMADMIGFAGDMWVRLGMLAGLRLVPPLTRDQAQLLRIDSIVPDGADTLADLGIAATADTLADLGIAATAAEVVLPTYLDRFRRQGRFRPARG